MGAIRRRVTLAVVSLLCACQLLTFLSYIYVAQFTEVAPTIEQSSIAPPRKEAIHRETISVLPLLDWEKDAMGHVKNGSPVCDQPVGVHDTCCPGSFSRGGEMVHFASDQCSHADYDGVETLARQFVESWRVGVGIGVGAVCDVCRMVDILKQIKEPLTVLGDSMMLQAFDGLHCELLRRNYLVEKNESIRKNWDHGWGRIKSRTLLLVKSPLWHQQHEVARIQMFFTYTVPFVIQEEAEEFNNAGGILWFNFGLHDYGDEHELPVFQKKMTSFFSTIRENATFSRIFFQCSAF